MGGSGDRPLHLKSFRQQKTRILDRYTAVGGNDKHPLTIRFWFIIIFFFLCFSSFFIFLRWWWWGFVSYRPLASRCTGKYCHQWQEPVGLIQSKLISNEMLMLVRSRIAIKIPTEMSRIIQIHLSRKLECELVHSTLPKLVEPSWKLKLPILKSVDLITWYWCRHILHPRLMQ